MNTFLIVFSSIISVFNSYCLCHLYFCSSLFVPSLHICNLLFFYHFTSFPSLLLISSLYSSFVSSHLISPHLFSSSFLSSHINLHPTQIYSETVPQSFLSYIDQKRNCEDIAMAHTVAREVRTLTVILIVTVIVILILNLN